MEGEETERRHPAKRPVQSMKPAETQGVKAAAVGGARPAAKQAGRGVQLKMGERHDQLDQEFERY